MTAIIDRTEAAEYYFTYIDKVGSGDICEILRAQKPETLSLLQSIDEEQSLYRYAPDKWSIREVLSHVEEFASIRDATLTFFENLPADAWTRRGVASGNPFTVRALAYIIAGHVTHHSGVLRAKYLKR